MDFIVRYSETLPWRRLAGCCTAAR